MIKTAYTTRTTCRVCGSSALTDLFSLGEQYVSDFPDRASRKDAPYAGVKVPIDLVLCRGCTLVQLRHTAPSELLYSRHYWYKSGTTATMRAALRDVTAAVEKRVNLQPGDVVLDIGSNDGTLLRSYTTPGTTRVGVEPATNLAKMGSQGVDYLVQNFWDYDLYIDCLGAFGVENKQAKVVTACGMLYDLEDPQAFVRDVARALHPDGLFVAQLMCLKNMLNVGDIGNLAHEHLLYFTLRSLIYLFGQHGLEIFDIETNTVNGESYRLFVRHAKGKRRAGITHALMREDGLDRPEYYAAWFARQLANRDRCVTFIKDAVAAGKGVWVYGASTKGNCILQFYGLAHNLITAAADRSPEKWGRETVGTRIPIVSEEDFRRADPPYALVLPYAFLPEFVERESAWRKRGGRFIVPLPTFRIV